MAHTGPHISISDEQLFTRVFGMVDMEQVAQWPESVRKLASDLAAELFMVRYNPFIDPELVRKSVDRRLNMSRPLMSGEYPKILSAGIREFWQSFDADTAFRKDLVERLEDFMPKDGIGDDPLCIVQSCTDATDLRMELPMLVVYPETEEQIRRMVKLAGEMGFSLIPRGGGTGLTGGAIPTMNRCVILSLARFKKIIDVNPDEQTITVQTGVITLSAIKAAAEQDLLLTVDPASKAGSSIGGNLSENAGGPFAFEYGTTIDNILSYRMVTPQGEIITVVRRDHPRHKVFETDTAVFDVYDESGKCIDTVELTGQEIRSPGLGKDVSNKYLGGLPGVQKEGVDGIFTETTLVCYPRPKHSRVLCLEFYGRSMRNAMYVIKDVVGLRDTIREQGDLVKISALEEFGTKYVQAIEYKPKTSQYDGDPISVIIMQLDSDHEEALDDAVETVVSLADNYEGVDIFAARDEKEAELFWEDRHKLSAISKRTSGFKINEDIVIPLEVIPDFSDFLENLNLEYLARIYRRTLYRVRDLPGMDPEDADLDEGLERGKAIMRGEITFADISDQEQESQCRYLFAKLRDRYPKLDREIKALWEQLQAKRVIIANHMHAGDGNCHVNLPVNSNDPEMLEEAHRAAGQVFEKVLELDGVVSGEHGIGITKINYLDDEKISALAAYKKKVDPRDILNPGKLTSRKLPSEPFTFSFNRLIQDLDMTALKDKEELMQLLRDIQTCTRCGKCKQVCPMFHPQSGLMHHPRNKNIGLGALIEAIYYAQIQSGRPDPGLLDRLRGLMEHCTACGKCQAVCPVKIDSAGAALRMRAFLDYKGRSGHPVKKVVLERIAQDPAQRLPKVAKALSLGQTMQSKAVGLMPPHWRRKFKNPAISSPTPHMDFRNLFESLELDKGFVLKNPNAAKDDTVLYFPGCGAALFSRDIGMATVYLLLKAGLNVVLPGKHMCCGYPLLASGCEEAYKTNRHRNGQAMLDLLVATGKAGLKATTLLTACGTCRESLETHEFARDLVDPLAHMDAVQFLSQRLDKVSCKDEVIYHAACHAEWVDVPKAKAAEMYRSALQELTGAKATLSPGCCGESGLGALSSPEIYNRIRNRKKEQLREDTGEDRRLPVVVGCPSCKVGISRCLAENRQGNPVLHTVEYLARCMGGPKWKRELKQLMSRVERRGH
ncbi:FAD-binding and (Fe-S)-binding domain-containing protein [Salidesulfovibrio brasiliensis]|uniref:FAD-binding and (Fe-S)-binding domain-containing protein n=1 Tax=Salidesulfovibrio brasiliensis TaxID=221711 RepID=UPI0006D1090E|nr:FAD-binding and (Fe-S)-binding domain-containing protein [Salidesulfovibrio brasiliensis]